VIRVAPEPIRVPDSAEALSILAEGNRSFRSRHYAGKHVTHMRLSGDHVSVVETAELQQLVVAQVATRGAMA
jgi:hypothetical protein